MSKNKFADLVEPTLADFTSGTVAWILQRYIEDMPLVNPDKPLGLSHLYTLRTLQKAPIGQKIAATLKKTDVIDHCKLRRQKVQPQTINQDITYLRGPLKFAGSAWDDCEDVSDAAVAAAMPLLVKYQLIGKSTPRKRVPSGDELERLLAYFAEYTKRPKVKLKVVPVILFALASTRRISEICRMTHGDIDWERKDASGNPEPMYMVRDLKHPKKKKGNDKSFALLEPMPEIIRMMPRLTDDPNERVFPFRHQSVGAAYVTAKKKLGIVNLHFHDNRREAITRWLKVFKSPHKVKLISGHENTLILERVYDATDPASLHGEFAAVVAKVKSESARP